MSSTTLPEQASRSQILFYQSEDGSSRIEVRLDEGTVWLSQALIAELYQITKQNGAFISGMSWRMENLPGLQQSRNT
jgi:hypothetical protein